MVDIQKVDILILMGFMNAVFFGTGIFITNYMIYRLHMDMNKEHTYMEEMAETRKLELDQKIMNQLHRIEDQLND